MGEIIGRLKWHASGLDLTVSFLSASPLLSNESPQKVIGGL